MDNTNKKLILYTALLIVSMMLVQKWNQFTLAQPGYENKSIPSANPRQTPGQTNSSRSQTSEELGSALTPSVELPHPNGETFSLKNDKLSLTFNESGEDIINAQLLKFPEKMHESSPMQLFNLDESKFYFAKTGLADTNKQIEDVPFTMTQLKDRTAVMTGSLGKLTITKRLQLSEDSYSLNVRYTLKNNGNETWTGHVFQQLSRRLQDEKKKGFLPGITTFEGASLSDPNGKSYEKIPYKTLQKKPLFREVESGWLALQQHYFLSAWIPEKGLSSQFYGNYKGHDTFTVGMMSEPLRVQAGQTQTYDAKLYVGPEELDHLRTAAPALDLTIDFGWVWALAKMILWLLTHVNHLIGNWGWSIITVTFIIKLLLYPLSAKSYKSMAAMKKLQPKLEAIKKRYGDDREALGKATMEMYQKEKINPFGGCLPMLIQIPIFISLYYVLLESVHLRQADFALWIHDLSVPDPYYVLPLLMGLTMLVQQKLSPPPPDPTQAKMMLIFPVMFCLIGLNFSAGLALYMLTNSCLSILQQWYNTRKYEESSKAHR